MNAVAKEIAPVAQRASRYARIVKASKKVEWQTDRDLIRGRDFDFSRKFLPDGLSYIDRLPFLGEDDAREEPASVSHRLERRVLGQVVDDVREQHRCRGVAVGDRGRVRLEPLGDGAGQDVEEQLFGALALARGLASALHVLADPGITLEIEIDVLLCRAALDRLRMIPYDLLITDLKMPGVDGLTVIREARRLKADLPVIIITGFSNEASAIEAVNLGVSGYLTKPFRVPRVLAAAAKALGE